MFWRYINVKLNKRTLIWCTLALRQSKCFELKTWNCGLINVNVVHIEGSFMNFFIIRINSPSYLHYFIYKHRIVWISQRQTSSTSSQWLVDSILLFSWPNYCGAASRVSSHRRTINNVMEKTVGQLSLEAVMALVLVFVRSWLLWVSTYAWLLAIVKKWTLHWKGSKIKIVLCPYKLCWLSQISHNLNQKDSLSV